MTEQAMLTLDQHYLQVWDGVLTSEFCQQLIEDFEACELQHREVPSRLIELELINRHIDPLTLQTRDWTRTTDYLMGVVNARAQDYRQRWDPHGMMPDQYAAEGFRMKCYRPEQHQFLLHVDQANRDSATRFLAFLLYVNDSPAGTEFPQLDLTVEARQGRLLIFPPNWQYPHCGHMPREHSKYIISTYFHYAY